MSGSLGFDRAKIKQGSNDAIDLNVNILQSFQTKTWDIAPEETFLIYQDDTAISYGQDIQVVVGPDSEDADPDDH